MQQDTIRSDRSAHQVVAGRPRYQPLGVDDMGYSHVYQAATDTIHVVAPDGTRERYHNDGEGGLGGWMALIEDRRGWETRRYGHSAIADALGQLTEVSG